MKTLDLSEYFSVLLSQTACSGAFELQIQAIQTKLELKIKLSGPLIVLLSLNTSQQILAIMTSRRQ